MHCLMLRSPGHTKDTFVSRVIRMVFWIHGVLPHLVSTDHPIFTFHSLPLFAVAVLIRVSQYLLF